MERFVKQAEFVEISGLSKGQVSKLCSGGKIDYDSVSKRIDLRGKKTSPYLPEEIRQETNELLIKQAQIQGGKDSSPQKYDPLVHNDMARECSSEGRDHLATCSYLGISRATFFNWRRDHPTFLDAWDEGMVIFAEEALMRRAGGCHVPETKINVVDKELVTTEMEKHFPPETKAATFIVSNRNKVRWPDKQNIDIGAKIEVVPRTKEELLKEIEEYEKDA